MMLYRTYFEYKERYGLSGLDRNGIPKKRAGVFCSAAIKKRPRSMYKKESDQSFGRLLALPSLQIENLPNKSGT